MSKEELGKKIDELLGGIWKSQQKEWRIWDGDDSDEKVPLWIAKYIMGKRKKNPGAILFFMDTPLGQLMVVDIASLEPDEILGVIEGLRIEFDEEEDDEEEAGEEASEDAD